MKHHINPTKLQTGDVVLFSGHTIWSRMIRLISESKWSHVGMIVRYGADAWVVEALEGKGVRFIPFSVWQKWSGEVGHLQAVAGLSVDSLTTWCLSHVGQEYASPRQFIRSFAPLWLHLRKFFGRLVDTDAKRFFCSEKYSFQYSTVI